MAHTEPSQELPRDTAPLVRAIHAASLHSADWPMVLERLGTHLGAGVVTLAHHEFSSGVESALFESPGELRFSRDMAAYSARNPWFLSSDDYTAGRVMTGDELIAEADLRRTDFYRGFLQPRGLLHRLCGVAARRGGSAHLLAVYRTEAQGAFGAREKAELGMLLDHVTLSLECHWRWQEADDLARVLLAQTGHDAHPMILVTADGETIHRNPAADHVLERHLGLRLEGTRLAAANAGDQRLLRETIAKVAQCDSAQSSSAPSVVTLACTPPVVAVVRAAGQAFMRRTGQRSGLAVVSVRGGHAGHDPATCVFARQYELTAAQARVSALVFSGQPLAGIAQSLNVSENTVRSHLKQIFQKTDTHGQMDLVHLHARMCTALQ